MLEENTLFSMPWQCCQGTLAFKPLSILRQLKQSNTAANISKLNFKCSSKLGVLNTNRLWMLQQVYIDAMNAWTFWQLIRVSKFWVICLFSPQEIQTLWDQRKKVCEAALIKREKKGLHVQIGKSYERI